MPAPKAQKTAKPATTGSRAKQGRKGNGRGANRQSSNPSDLLEISERAWELARLVQAQALDQDVAAVLGDQHLPMMMQKLLDNSLSGGPAAAQAVGLIMRLLKHPAASAADKLAADRGRPGALRAALVGRLTGGSGSAGRAAVTVEDAPSPKALPF